MVTRRQSLSRSMATKGDPATVPACSSATAADSYEQAVSRTLRHVRVDGSNKQAVLRELVRYATLAPSSHNTQCWKFHVEADSISVLPDFSRRCPAVDPDDHHLFVSIGCAAENLVHAASANGLHAESVFDSSSGGKLHVSLESTQAVASHLFDAIPERQSTRGEYDGKPIPSRELALLESAGTGNGV